jgi:protein-S-isoprenylcysteine O-methyltransferase Ste14
MKFKELIGSGDKIGLFTLPFLIVGLIVNILFPSIFNVGGPASNLTILSIIILIPGIVIWAWSVILISTKVSKNELITYGPYLIVKHPLYTCVAFLVAPWIGILLNSWIGIIFGLILYIGSRMYSPQEEEKLARLFGKSWEEYNKKVIIPWL